MFSNVLSAATSGWDLLNPVGPMVKVQVQGENQLVPLPGWVAIGDSAWRSRAPQPTARPPCASALEILQELRSRKLPAGPAVGVDSAVLAHVKLGTLTVELRLGAVAQVLEPARVLQAGGEHRKNEGHGCSSIVAMSPSGLVSDLATPRGVADDWGLMRDSFEHATPARRLRWPSRRMALRHSAPYDHRVRRCHEDTRMPRIRLNDGTTVPQFGFGTLNVQPDRRSTPANIERTAEVVGLALELGYRHIDTAQSYGNEKGVGKAIAASRIPRDELYVTSKLSNGNHHPDDVRRSFDETLEKLGLERLDLRPGALAGPDLARRRLCLDLESDDRARRGWPPTNGGGIKLPTRASRPHHR